MSGGRKVGNIDRGSCCILSFYFVSGSSNMLGSMFLGSTMFSSVFFCGSVFFSSMSCLFGDELLDRAVLLGSVMGFLGHSVFFGGSVLFSGSVLFGCLGIMVPWFTRVDCLWQSVVLCRTL